jgi:asparagine synthase (glutamine-hydrolysing)
MEAEAIFRAGSVWSQPVLLIIDLRTGDQPIGEARGAIVVANGEIYNDLELRSQLRDVSFRTGSDCESPLLYRRKGIDFAQDLHGMYGIAIYDPATAKLILARDPLGIKPLYYVQTPTCFAFASEPQALIAAGLARSVLRPLARAELFQLKFTTGSNTMRHLSSVPLKMRFVTARVGDARPVLDAQVKLYSRKSIAYS